MQRIRKNLQWCPSCQKLVEAEYTLTFNENLQLVADTSVCPCGRFLWNWHWDPNAPPARPPKPKPKQLELF